MQTPQAPAPATKADQTLSVIIPAMNAATTLPALLDTLLELEMPAGWQKEIIASYTESHDDTLAILQARPVQIVRCTTIGPSAARNTGVQAATGVLLYFIDADARPVGTDFFVRLIRTAVSLGKRKRLGAFGGPILLEPSQNRNPIAHGDHFACWFNWSPARRTQQTTLFQPTVSLAMPHAVFKSLGGFDPAIRVMEDFDLQRKALRANLRLYFVQDLAVTHHARGRLLTSWRHSWYWGTPYRSGFLEKVRDPRLKVPVQSKWFWLNLPFIYARRMRLVTRSAWRNSRKAAIWALPFIACTVFAWSLAAVVGKGQPDPETPHAA